MLPELLGRSKKGRSVVVEQGIESIAILSGDWKYIAPNNGNRMDTLTNIELGNSRQPQLFNLKEDIGEKNNLAEKNPSKLKEMEALLLNIKNKK